MILCAKCRHSFTFLSMPCTSVIYWEYYCVTLLKLHFMVLCTLLDLEKYIQYFASVMISEFLLISLIIFLSQANVVKVHQLCRALFFTITKTDMYASFGI